MRTTLDLPEPLIEEARRLLGFKSKTDTVVLSLREMVRRKRIEELKDLLGTVRLDVDIAGTGVSNWISDYGTADIYRTKGTEFFGTPWENEARDRMIKQSPLTHAGNVKTPTLFVHGELDQRVPYEEGEQMYFALKRRGIPAQMIQYAGQPHSIGGHWNSVH